MITTIIVHKENKTKNTMSNPFFNNTTTNNNNSNIVTSKNNEDNNLNNNNMDNMMMKNNNNSDNITTSSSSISSSSGNVSSSSGGTKSFFSVLDYNKKSNENGDNATFQAFNTRLIIDKIDASGISAVALYGDHVYVGTPGGRLFLYLVSDVNSNPSYSSTGGSNDNNNNSTGKSGSSLLTSRRIQSRKEVLKIIVVPQFQHVLLLCGGRVSVHDMYSLETIKNSTDNIASVVKSAQGFAVDQKSNSLSRLCIASKRKKIILFDYARGEYVFWKDIPVNDVPISMKWHGDSIYVGHKTIYNFINVTTDNQIDVPIPIKNVSPLIHILPQGYVLLASNEIGVLVDENGNPVAGVVDWTGKDAVDAVSCYPYFIILSKSISAKNMKINIRKNSNLFNVNVHYNGMEHQMLQEIGIDGKNPILVSEDGMRRMMEKDDENGESNNNDNKMRVNSKLGSGSGRFNSSSLKDTPVLLATSSPNQIFCLQGQGYLDQSAWLLHNDKIREAEQLLTDTMKYMTLDGMDKELLMRDFHSNAAVTMFLKFQLKDNGTTILDHVNKCELDPRELLHLFPDLHPLSLPPSGYVPKYCTKELMLKASLGKEANDVDSIAAARFSPKKALKMQGRLDDELSIEDAVENARLCILKILESQRLRCTTSQEQHIVDTGIFILYATMKGREKDLDSFIQTPNAIQAVDVRDMLQRLQRFHILAVLHREKNPREALEIWRRMGTGEYKDVGKGSGIEQTVECLSEIEDEELVWTFSSWIMRMDYIEGTKIFYNRDKNTELKIQPTRVLDFIKTFEGESGDTAIDWPAFARRQYLEFIIETNGSEDPHLSTQLAILYMETVLAYRETTKTKLRRGNAGTEPGDLGLVRSTGLEFLRNSKFYNVEQVLQAIVTTELYEERIILLNRLGSHKEALRIYAYKTNSIPEAVTYCKKYSPSMEEDPTRARSLFLLLVTLLLNPATEDAASITRKERYRRIGMELLVNYASEMEPVSVMKQLPKSISIASLQPFLEKVIQHVTHRKRQDIILCNVAKVENLQARSELAKLESRGVVVDTRTLCDICKKPIDTKTVFVVYPNNVVAHYSCLRGEERLKFDPISGKRFVESNKNNILTDYYDGFLHAGMMEK